MDTNFWQTPLLLLFYQVDYWNDLAVHLPKYIVLYIVIETVQLRTLVMTSTMLRIFSDGYLINQSSNITVHLRDAEHSRLLINFFVKM